jgi:hypothetical protein
LSDPSSNSAPMTAPQYVANSYQSWKKWKCLTRLLSYTDCMCGGGKKGHKVLFCFVAISWCYYKDKFVTWWKKIPLFQAPSPSICPLIQTSNSLPPTSPLSHPSLLPATTLTRSFFLYYIISGSFRCIHKQPSSSVSKQYIILIK